MLHAACVSKSGILVSYQGTYYRRITDVRSPLASSIQRLSSFFTLNHYFLPPPPTFAVVIDCVLAGPAVLH